MVRLVVRERESVQEQSAGSASLWNGAEIRKKCGAGSISEAQRNQASCPPASRAPLTPTPVDPRAVGPLAVSPRWFSRFIAPFAVRAGQGSGPELLVAPGAACCWPLGQMPARTTRGRALPVLLGPGSASTPIRRPDSRVPPATGSASAVDIAPARRGPTPPVHRSPGPPSRAPHRCTAPPATPEALSIGHNSPARIRSWYRHVGTVHERLDHLCRWPSNRIAPRLSGSSFSGWPFFLSLSSFVDSCPLSGLGGKDVVRSSLRLLSLWFHWLFLSLSLSKSCKMASGPRWPSPRNASCRLRSIRSPTGGCCTSLHPNSLDPRRDRDDPGDIPFRDYTLAIRTPPSEGRAQTDGGLDWRLAELPRCGEHPACTVGRAVARPDALLTVSVPD